MFTARVVFFLEHIFRLREKMQIHKVDEEKPFLQHLDDLRKMILRMILCLLVAMILCFNYASELISILQYPADQVWDMREKEHLPTSVTFKEWNSAKSFAGSLGGLNEKGKEAILSRLDDRSRLLVDCVPVLSAARLLGEKERSAFIVEASPTQEVAQLAQQLEETGALLAEGNSRDAVKLMSTFQVGEGFMLSMKLAFYAGVIISSPFLFYFLFQFVVPGLLEKERKIIYKCMFYSLGLFLIGVCFSYFIVLPRVLMFFYEYSLELGISNEWRIGYYITFASRLVFLFGVSFELPIVIYPFIKLGVLTYEVMSSTRRYAIVGIAVLAAVITPTPDVLTMMLMAVPMYILYELCIILARVESKRNLKKQEEEKKDADEAYGIS